jgi:hypothetical protein
MVTGPNMLTPIWAPDHSLCCVRCPGTGRKTVFYMLNYVMVVVVLTAGPPNHPMHRSNSRQPTHFVDQTRVNPPNTSLELMPNHPSVSPWVTAMSWVTFILDESQLNDRRGCHSIVSIWSPGETNCV